MAKTASEIHDEVTSAAAKHAEGVLRPTDDERSLNARLSYVERLVVDFHLRLCEQAVATAETNSLLRQLIAAAKE